MYQNTKIVPKAVLDKMRNLAIKQAVSELPDNATQDDFNKVARRHYLRSLEVKGAYYHYAKKKKQTGE